MNEYTVEFFSACPANGVRVKYTLTIQAHEVIVVEALLDVTSRLTVGFHEDHADLLFQKFGGLQTLRAHHHGVDIKTTRQPT